MNLIRLIFALVLPAPGNGAYADTKPNFLKNDAPGLYDKTGKVFKLTP